MAAADDKPYTGDCGGHAIDIVGYIDTGAGKIPGSPSTTGYYIIRNSWGTTAYPPVHDGGYAYVPYDKIYLWSAMTVTDVEVC
jgi:C1A family cysteine protease